MRGSLSQRPASHWRLTALITLVALLTGSVGVPVGTGGIARGAGAPAGCCCGKKSRACSCGCCLRAAEKTRAAGGSCCRKKNPSEAIPVVSCPCGDQPASGFVISTQPRLIRPRVTLPALQPAARMANKKPLAPPDHSHSPETPPPRPSDC